jgi:hypothetical protein
MPSTRSQSNVGSTSVMAGAGTTAVRRRTRRRARTTALGSHIQKFSTPRGSANFDPGLAREELYGLLKSQRINLSGTVSTSVHDQAAGLIDYWMNKTLGIAF